MSEEAVVALCVLIGGPVVIIGLAWAVLAVVYKILIKADARRQCALWDIESAAIIARGKAEMAEIMARINAKKGQDDEPTQEG